MNYQNSLGILLMFLATLFFSLMNLLIKILSEEISITQSMFFRSLLMCGFILILFLYKPIVKTGKKGGYFPLLLRTLSGSFSMLLFFYNISTIPLGTASTYAQSMPIYATLFAWIFLKEKTSYLTLIATLLGFGGIVLISNPSANIPLLNILAGVVSGATAGIAMVSIRSCKAYFDERVIVLAFGATATLLTLFLFYFAKDYTFAQWNPIISLKTWLLIIAMGLVGTLGQILMTKAFILAPAGIVSPIEYTKIIISLILGTILGDALPNFESSIGMFLVIISGLLIAMPVFIKDFKQARKDKKRQ